MTYEIVWSAYFRLGSQLPGRFLPVNGMPYCITASRPALRPDRFYYTYILIESSAIDINRQYGTNSVHKFLFYGPVCGKSADAGGFYTMLADRRQIKLGGLPGGKRWGRMV